MLLTFRSFISFLRPSLLVLVQNPGICAIIIQLAGMKSSDMMRDRLVRAGPSLTQSQGVTQRSYVATQADTTHGSDHRGGGQKGAERSLQLLPPWSPGNLELLSQPMRDQESELLTNERPGSKQHAHTQTGAVDVSLAWTRGSWCVKDIIIREL